MRLLARAVAALALLSLATPALPCGDKEHVKTASTEKKTTTVAKASAAKRGAAPAAKAAGQAKPASAAN